MSDWDEYGLARIRREFGRKEAEKRAQEIGLQFADLTKFKPEPDALALVSRALALQHTVLPLKKQDGVLFLAVADPGDLQAADAVRLACRCTVRPVIAARDDIQRAIARLYPIEERDALKNALIKDEWTITHAPLHIDYAGHEIACGLAAQKQSDNGDTHIAVQFADLSPSLPMDALCQAMGKYAIRDCILHSQEPTRALYMAVSRKMYELMMAEEIGEITLRTKGLRFLIFDGDLEIILHWHKELAQ